MVAGEDRSKAELRSPGGSPEQPPARGDSWHLQLQPRGSLSHGGWVGKGLALIFQVLG